jgi:lincosamide and streptogramin A transport system ATP-binding/permease protein
MSQITVKNLSFHYEGSPDNVFEGVSFQLDTDWKLGFISRNGRGKTTFLRLLTGAFPYQGEISAAVDFSYFPFEWDAAAPTALAAARRAIAPFDVWEADMEAALADGSEAALLHYGELQELMLLHDGYQIDELIAREAGKLQVSPDALMRPLDTLSLGERTKLQIAALFLRKNHFLLIDEPTNHLDAHGRQTLERYLAAKRGFILVSHDRALLDGVVDHVLSINRATIEVMQGNYSTWQENRALRDQFEQKQNERLGREISQLTDAMHRTERWSDAIEATKIGSGAGDRGYIGHQAARMMQRAKATERRIGRSIEEKTGLLKDIETAEPLKLSTLPYPKKRLIELSNVQVDYGQGALFAPLSFSLFQGERVAIAGANGSGKSSLIKLLLGEAIPHTGICRMGSGLTIAYVSQDTGHLNGLPGDFARREGIDETLFKTILRKLDFPRREFDRPMESYSGGQKKKVLLAASLCRPAHLYLWDEPLNFVDILSRVQIETLLCDFAPTMLSVEHDRRFAEAVANRPPLVLVR